MTLDGFFGTLHTELFNAGVVTDEPDDKWKETLARDCHHYRVLRDTAYALKHGTLNRPKPPRLVRRSDQVVARPGRVWIEADDTHYKADEVIKTVLVLASEWLAKVPR
jgi:hypothetical protein